MLNEEDRAAGLLLNLTGDGKGKTSGALGMTVRALGWGWRVAVVQFMKGDLETGERSFFRTHFPEMIFEQYGLGLLSRPGDHAGMAQRGWARARELLAEFPGELLVLDELNNALTHGFVDLDEALDALKRRREALNVIVTGRYAPPELVELSDLVSEIREVKHPYRRGIPARKGLDY